MARALAPRLPSWSPPQERLAATFQQPGRCWQLAAIDPRALASSSPGGSLASSLRSEALCQKEACCGGAVGGPQHPGTHPAKHSSGSCRKGTSQELQFLGMSLTCACCPAHRVSNCIDKTMRLARRVPQPIGAESAQSKAKSFKRLCFNATSAVEPCHH